MPMAPACATPVPPGAALRPFGLGGTAVLALDFQHAGREVLLTELLAACGGGPASALAAWPLARRTQALVALRLLEEPGAMLEAQRRCGACGEGFEFSLPLAALPQGIGADTFTTTGPQGQVLTLRLPTAADLQAWQLAPHDAGHLAASLLLQVDGLAPGPGFVVPAAWHEPMALALDEADPLTAFSVLAACPHCGAANNTAVDVQALLLHHFAGQQQALLHQVWQLARRLHWSEAQILALPAWRRAWYLQQAEALA